MSARSVNTAKAALFQQLATAMRNGLPLAEVVHVLVDDDQWTPRSRAALRRVAARLGAGDALSAAMATEPRLFVPETVALVRAAEALAPADAADVLASLAADARRLAAARRAIAVTMTWPLTLGCVLLVELAVCATFVRPAMLQAFDAMRAVPPAVFPAGVLIDSGWLWLPPIYLVLVLWYFGWLPRPVRALLESGADRIGFVRRWRAATAAGRLLEWLPLCHAQPPLRVAVAAQLAATEPSVMARAAARRMGAAFQHGTPLVETLAAERALPARMALLARLGERSATLPAVLADLQRDAAEDEALAFARFERGCVLLFYAVIGVLVAQLLVGVYLPIFKIGALT